MWSILDNPLNEQRDLVLASIPWVDTQYPLPGPASLKSAVENAGFSCLAVDTNYQITSILKTHDLKTDLKNFFLDGKMVDQIKPVIQEYASALADKILCWNPKWVGLSLLVSDNQYFSRWVIFFLRKKNPSVKIIIGGPGCGLTGSGEGDTFAPQLLKTKLIDYYVQGDGEISLPELLKGNINYPGINGTPWQYLTSQELEDLPFPDYHDYKIGDIWPNNIPLGITSSRGCVRNCTFCDYIETHKKFQWRKAENVFEEVLYQNKIYGSRAFAFSDALVNGNTKEFNKFIELMANHNEQNPDNQFRWGGYYIVRNKSENDAWVWDTMKRSGARMLSIGFEHFSKKIRYDMDKKFDDESIVHHLKFAQQHKIKVNGLMVLGYPTETEADRQINLDWLYNNRDLNDTVIFSWSLMRIIPNTQVERKVEEFGIMLNDKLTPAIRIKLWDSSMHENTYELREKWLHEHVAVCRANGFKLDADVYSNLQARYILAQELIINDTWY